MTSPAELVLARLEPFHVHPTGQGRWRAMCPSCGESSRNKLALGQGSTGVLLHCHGGCSFEAVLGALGLEPQDLFDRLNDDYGPRARVRPIDGLTPSLALELVVEDATFLCLIANDLTELGLGIPKADQDRLIQCAARFNALLEKAKK